LGHRVADSLFDLGRLFDLPFAYKLDCLHDRWDIGGLGVHRGKCKRVGRQGERRARRGRRAQIGRPWRDGEDVLWA